MNEAQMNPDQKFRIAHDPEAPPLRLDYLADDSSEIIRGTVAANTGTRRDALLRLERDTSPYVRKILSARLVDFPAVKSVRFRPIETADAEYVLSLRVDERYNRYLSEVPDDIAKQKLYIEDYKQNDEGSRSWYFIIERLDGTPCGTVRLYNFTSESFEWGSWILDTNKTRFAAVETAVFVYLYAFRNLGFERCDFEVRKGNAKVLQFHKRTGAEPYHEDDENVYFRISRSTALSWCDKMQQTVLYGIPG